LPIERAGAEGHDGGDLQEGATEDEGFEVAGIHSAAGGDADEEEEGCLEGADPGDGGGDEVEVGSVIGLKGAEGGYEAPARGDYEVWWVLAGEGLFSGKE